MAIGMLAPAKDEQAITYTIVGSRGEMSTTTVEDQYSMTHKKRSPRKSASSLFSLSPPGYDISHLIICLRPSMVYLLKTPSISCDVACALSPMKLPKAMPMMTSFATSQREL